MSDGNISLPQWSLGLVAGAISLAVAWGVLQSNVAYAEEERQRIMAIAEEAAKKAQANGQQVAVNSTKLEVIVQSLSEQKEIQQKTNEQIAALVQAMLAKE
tara:strand:- start:1066 stop:1368 length:303 start_codon:yes stop_codon:yes gene_type:complete